MRERGSFERELRLLRGREDAARDYELTLEWKKDASGGFESASLSTPDQDEKGRVTVAALRFPGTSSEVALVFAGVHGNEPDGVEVLNRLAATLKSAAARGAKPAFTAILLPRLFAAARNRGKRFVPLGKKLLEPNRNFPAPGESYDYARERGKRRRDKAELLDCRGLPADGERVTHRMLAETRILLQLIESERPVRAASVHSHSVPGSRGDGPGIFVDPRGLFNEHTDVAFTAEGKQDDSLAQSMLQAALASVAPSLPLTNDAKKKQVLSHPLRGNLVDASGKINPASATVHYTSTKHPCGTSFGGWAPHPEHSGARKGISTITVETPNYRDAAKARSEMIRVHAAVLASVFLGLP